MSGAGGSMVTLSGTNFGVAQGTVSFSGTSATISTWGDTSINAQVPATLVPGTYNVQVTNTDGSSNTAIHGY